MSDQTQIKATPDRLRRLAEADLLNAAQVDEALKMTGALPDLTRWRWFLDYLLLVLGAAMGVAGIFFFFAYNWNGLPRFAKLGLLELLVTLSAVVAIRMKLKGHPALITLTAAALLTGGLLAVYGQIYQIGADSYQLFLTWALLITGWVIVSDYTLLWVIWLVLVNLALSFFWRQRMGEETFGFFFVAFCVLNGLALAAWEGGKRRFTWLGTRWTPRLVSLALVPGLTSPMVYWLWVNLGASEYAYNQIILGPGDQIAAALYLPVMAVLLWFYSRREHDLFMLAIGLFSLMTCLTSAMINIMQFSNALDYLLVGGAIVLQAGLIVTILRKIANSWEAAV